MSQIDVIKARLAKCSAGQWLAPGSTGVLGAGVVAVPSGRVIALRCSSDDDAEFIANAPTDIEYLLSEVERLQKTGDQ